MSRTPKITRSDYFTQERRVDWLDRLAEELDHKEKSQTVVDVARARQQNANFVEQITSIVSGQPKFRTVDSKVKDMQERTGLAEYLRSVSAQSEKDAVNEKSAAEENTAVAKEPELFKKLDPTLVQNVKSFIDSKIKTHYGFTSVPAVTQDLLEVFKTRGLTPQQVNDEEFESYVQSRIDSALSLSNRTDSPNSFTGNKMNMDNDVHPGNTDVFYNIDGNLDK